MDLFVKLHKDSVVSFKHQKSGPLKQSVSVELNKAKQQPIEQHTINNRWNNDIISSIVSLML